MYGNSQSKSNCVHWGPLHHGQVNANKVLPNLKPQNSVFETKSFNYFIVAHDQMQMLHSPEKVLPLLCHQSMCRCLWHRAVQSAHPHPSTHRVPLGLTDERQADTNVRLSGSSISLNDVTDAKLSAEKQHFLSTKHHATAFQSSNDG